MTEPEIQHATESKASGGLTRRGLLAGAASVAGTGALAMAFPPSAWAASAPRTTRLEPFTGTSVTIESGFGSLTIDPQNTQLASLYLRDPAGELSVTSFIAPGQPTCYLTDNTGLEYTSQLSPDGEVLVQRDGSDAILAVLIRGIEFRSDYAGVTAVGQTPQAAAFAPDGQTVYVSNFGSGTLTPISMPDGTAGASIPVPSGPTGVVVTPDGTTAYVASWDTAVVAEVDLASGTVVNAYPVGTNPQYIALAPDGQTLLVPNQGSNTVTAINISTGAVGNAAPVQAAPTSVAITPDGAFAYVTNFNANTVTQLAISQDADGSPVLTPTGENIPVGSGPISAVITPDGSTAVVSVNHAGGLQTIDLATLAASELIPLGGAEDGPQLLALSPDGDTAYVANFTLNLVSVVNLADGSVQQTLYTATGSNPNGLALSPDGTLLVTANHSNATVSRFGLGDSGYVLAPVTENWFLRATPGGGKNLSWTIEQNWTADFSIKTQADPSIVFTPGIVSTFWYDPAMLVSASPDEPPFDYSFTTDLADTINSDHTWAVHKLWSQYHLASDLRLGVDGGFLTRYATRYGYTMQTGSRFDLEQASSVTAGTTRTLTLTLEPSDKYATGYQLNASIPDAATITSLRDFYQSLLNGGSISGQAAYLGGNEVAGYLDAYEALTGGTALNVGVPSRLPAAERAYTVGAAFRGYLAAILDSVISSGEIRFGLAAGGHYLDGGLWTLLGLYQYTIHTGDLTLFATYEAVIASMLDFWVSRIQSNGLILSLSSDGCYYDAISFGSSYYSTYYNAFVYEALTKMADLELALSHDAGTAALSSAARAAAESYTASAAGIKAAINSVLWTPNSPNGPMYADWIDIENGQTVYSFMGAAQYPAIVFGIASATQAAGILATANARLSQLPAIDGYTGEGTPNVLWPLPTFANIKDYAFGYYMNGGMFLYEAYYEVMARAMSGDADGAYARLQGFASGFEASSWFGTNWAEPPGTVINSEGNEPYLQDMILTAASLTQGILGIRGSWDALRVTPALPAGWSSARADVVYRGKNYRVTINSAGTADKYTVDIAPYSPSGT
jgi:YVTN family beta-propeller protein